MKSITVVCLAGLILGSSMVSTATPVLFTTNDGALYGPYRVQYISVYVDGAKKCYTESNGDCTSTPSLSPGLHKVDYVWAAGNAPPSSPIFGTATHFVLVPDQVATLIVRIPTVRVRFDGTKQEVRVIIKQSTSPEVVLGNILSFTNLDKNMLAGCYTVAYKRYSPIPAWPVIPGVPDADLKGFDRICVGSHDTYPAPTPAYDLDTNPPHVTFPVPNYWP